jgi:hypothetical protein
MYSDNGNKNKEDILKNEENIRLSYESDGKMGKEESTPDQDIKVEHKDFFNTTQSSE